MASGCGSILRVHVRVDFRMLAARPLFVPLSMEKNEMRAEFEYRLNKIEFAV